MTKCLVSYIIILRGERNDFTILQKSSYLPKEFNLPCATNGSELRSTPLRVSGGGSGVGKAIAKRLTAGGATVVIAGRTPEKLMKTAGEIDSDRLFTMTLDIADCERIPEKLTEAEALAGGLDGFVNAAALGGNQALGRGFEPWDITPDE